MKKGLLALLAVILTSFSVKPVAAQEISIEYFHDTLAPYGTWIQVEGYGDCWQPYVSDPDWRPYSLGHWVYTDEGWLWVSDEDFGSITYHYGRWINLDNRGWCWVPGYDWAPAWVSWRYSDDYCGWAPLPPEGVDMETGAGWYNFCPVSSMGAPDLRVVIINRSYNYIYINRTTVLTGSIIIGGRRCYAGPAWTEVNRRAAYRPVPRYELHRQTNASVPFAPRPSGGAITVYAPPVRRTSPKPSYPYPSAVVKSPAVNDGRNVYQPTKVGPYASPSAEPNRRTRAATPSVYKEQPAPPRPVGTTVQTTPTPALAPSQPRSQSQFTPSQQRQPSQSQFQPQSQQPSSRHESHGMGGSEHSQRPQPSSNQGSNAPAQRPSSPPAGGNNSSGDHHRGGPPDRQ